MKKLKVLLVNPICAPNLADFIRSALQRKVNADEPLGLAYISTWIKKNMSDKVKTEVYDHHIDSLKYFYKNKKKGNRTKIINLLKNKIKNYKPDVLGISASYHMNADVAHETAKITKKIKKQIITVMGGIYPTASPKEALEDKNIDFIIPGEGELPFEDFLNYQLGKKKIGELKAIGYRLPQSKRIFFTNNFAFIKNLDQLGVPDRSTLPIGKYSIYGRTLVDRFYHRNPAVASIQASRGCPFRCTYCCGHIITQRRFRTRKVSAVIAEMRYLKKKYKIEVFSINDENANVNPSWSLQLYEAIIKAKLNIKWVHGGGFYVHLMDEKLISKAIESGLILFNLAIESGSRRILKKVQKTEKIIEAAPRIVKIIRNINPKMYITGFFICGFPFETKTDLKKTINFAKDLDLDWAKFNLFQPFPGSDLYNYCLEKGYLKNGKFSRKNLLFYFSSKLKNTLIPQKIVEKAIYLANLEINFVNSRMIRIRNFKQAVRDFEHVVNVAPNHVLAFLCLGKTYFGLRRFTKARQIITKAKKIARDDKEQAEYLKYFKININNFHKNLVAD